LVLGTPEGSQLAAVFQFPSAGLLTEPGPVQNFSVNIPEYVANPRAVSGGRASGASRPEATFQRPPRAVAPTRPDAVATPTPVARANRAAKRPPATPAPV